MLLYAALYRAEGNLEKLKEFLDNALGNAELIEPGLVTATVYTFAGSVSDLINSPDSEEGKPDIFSMRALEHLQRAADSSKDLIKSDKKLKGHLNLAASYLSCNMSGQLLRKNIDKSRLEKAMAVQEFVFEGLLSSYYKVQLNLLLSVYLCRKAQVSSDEKSQTRFLRCAFDWAKEAERLARDCNFAELLEWSKESVALCTEDLVVHRFKNMRKKSTIH